MAPSAKSHSLPRKFRPLSAGVRAFAQLDGTERVWLLSALVAASALGLYAVSVGHLDAPDAPVHLPWWALAVLYYVVELCVVHLHFRGEAHSYTLSEIPLVLGLFLASPDDLVLGRVLAAAAALALTTRQRPVKLAFNISLFTLEIMLAVILFRAIVGYGDLAGWAGLGGAVVAALAGSVLTISMIWIAIALADGGMRRRDLARSLGLGLAVTATNASLALIGIALVWRDPELTFLLVPPTVVLLLAYRAHVAAQERHASLEFLHETTRLIHGSPELGAATVTLLSHARDVFRAEIGQITFLAAGEKRGGFCTTVGPAGEIEVMRPIGPPPDDGLEARVLSERHAILLPSAGRGVVHFTIGGVEVTDAIIAPLHGDTGIIGTMLLANRLGDISVFRKEDLKHFETLANHVGVSLENLQLEKQLAQLSQLLKERDQLEAQLRQAQKMEAVGRLAGGIAHDFNNLLTAITGYSELLLKRLGNDDRRRVQEIKKAADRAASLTSQLLAFSRKGVMQPRVLDLNEVVDGLGTMLRRLIGEHIELATTYARGLGRVKVDPGQLEQVILNLVVNAADAMPRGGVLALETANVEVGENYPADFPVQQGSYVALTVTDTGCGMDEETRSHVFEPFFTTKEVGKGTGLGLSTVYGIVKQNGGYVFVRSAPGEGSTFDVFLPQVEEVVPSRDEHALSAPPRGAETILLVEDEDVVRAVAREIFAMSGYAVLEAGNGSEALLLAERHHGPIHLLLTDVVMPEMSGPELARRLSPLRPEIRVIYMSGYPAEALGQHGEIGAETSFIQKPFSADEVLGRARDVLDEPAFAGKRAE